MKELYNVLSTSVDGYSVLFDKPSTIDEILKLEASNEGEYAIPYIEEVSIVTLDGVEFFRFLLV